MVMVEGLYLCGRLSSSDHHEWWLYLLGRDHDLSTLRLTLDPSLMAVDQLSTMVDGLCSTVHSWIACSFC